MLKSDESPSEVKKPVNIGIADDYIKDRDEIVIFNPPIKVGGNYIIGSGVSKSISDNSPGNVERHLRDARHWLDMYNEKLKEAEGGE